MTLRPLVATAPANVTVPPRGASDRRAGCATDVDSSVLPAGVRVVSEMEPGEHRPGAGHVHAPAAGASTRNRNAVTAAVRSERQHASTVGCGPRRCQYWLQTCHTFVRVLLQRSPVELVPPRAGQPGDEIGRLPARDSRVDELGDGGRGRAVVHHHRRRPEDECDLALRRLREPVGDLRGRPADDLLELLRQLPADGDRPLGERRRERSQSAPGSRRGDSNATTGQGQRASSSQSAASAASPRGR